MTDDDVQFVLEHCDTNGDQAISCDEIMNMAQLWFLVTGALPAKKRYEGKRQDILARKAGGSDRTSARDEEPPPGGTLDGTGSIPEEAADPSGGGSPPDDAVGGAPPQRTTAFCVIL